jgi:hypothetical protein
MWRSSPSSRANCADVIEDIEGATTEPARRRHVLVLSGAVATVSLVLLLALVVPPPRFDAPPLVVATRAPAVSGSTIFGAGGSSVVTFPTNPLSQQRIDLERVHACIDGTRSNPAFYVLFEAGTGRAVAVSFDGRTGSPVPVAYLMDTRNGPPSVTCATSESLVPRINRAR